MRSDFFRNNSLKLYFWTTQDDVYMSRGLTAWNDQNRSAWFPSVFAYCEITGTIKVKVKLCCKYQNKSIISLLFKLSKDRYKVHSKTHSTKLTPKGRSDSSLFLFWQLKAWVFQSVVFHVYLFSSKFSFPLDRICRA